MARKRKKILVFTGGGLAPALNATLYGVVKQAREFNWQILGGLYGWACLGRKGQIVKLGQIDIEPLKNVGGTILRSSRINPHQLPGGVKAIKQKIKAMGINFLSSARWIGQKKVRHLLNCDIFIVWLQTNRPRAISCQTWKEKIIQDRTTVF